MYVIKYFFGCPDCGDRYLKKSSKGIDIDNTTYHFFRCNACDIYFARVTKGGKLVENIYNADH